MLQSNMVDDTKMFVREVDELLNMSSVLWRLVGISLRMSF